MDRLKKSVARAALAETAHAVFYQGPVLESHHDPATGISRCLEPVHSPNRTLCEMQWGRSRGEQIKAVDQIVRIKGWFQFM